MPISVSSAFVNDPSPALAGPPETAFPAAVGIITQNRRGSPFRRWRGGWFLGEARLCFAHSIPNPVERRTAFSLRQTGRYLFGMTGLAEAPTLIIEMGKIGIVALILFLSTGLVLGQQRPGKRRRTPANEVSVTVVPPPIVGSPFVVVKSPQDTLDIDYTKVYDVSIAINYHACLILPIKVRAIACGNFEYFRAWALEEESETPTPENEIKSPQLLLRRNARFILVKPVQPVEQNIGGTLVPVETSLTLRLESPDEREKLILLRLRLGSPEQSVYRITFRDPVLESERKRVEEVRAEAERRAAAAEQEALRRAEKTKRKLTEALVSLETGLNPTGWQTQRRTLGDLNVGFACGRIEGVAVGAVSISMKNRSKEPPKAEVEWMLDGQLTAADLSVKNEGSTFGAGFGPFPMPNRPVPQSMTVSIVVKGKSHSISMILPPEVSVPGEFTRQPPPNLGPVVLVKDTTDSVSGCRAADQLAEQMKAGSVEMIRHEEAGVIGSLAVARSGSRTAAVLSFDQQGKSEITLSSPKWTGNGLPVEPVCHIGTHARALGSRPIIMGFEFEGLSPGVQLEATVQVGADTFIIGGPGSNKQGSSQTPTDPKRSPATVSTNRTEDPGAGEKSDRSASRAETENTLGNRGKKLASSPAVAAAADYGKEQARFEIGGVVLKVLDIKVVENRRRLVVEFVNLGNESVTGFTAHCLVTKSDDGMTASKHVPSEAVYTQRPVLAKGDHTRACFDFNASLRPSFEIAWKEGNKPKTCIIP